MFRNPGLFSSALVFPRIQSPCHLDKGRIELKKTTVILTIAWLAGPLLLSTLYEDIIQIQQSF